MFVCVSVGLLGDDSHILGLRYPLKSASGTRAAVLHTFGHLELHSTHVDAKHIKELPHDIKRPPV